MSGLDVPADGTWLSALGVVPETEEASGDEYVRELRIPTADGEQLRITWDATDASVRVRHERAGRVVVDLYREQATQVSVEKTDHTTTLMIEYNATGAKGRAHIQVVPDVVIEDKFLQA